MTEQCYPDVAALIKDFRRQISVMQEEHARNIEVTLRKFNEQIKNLPVQNLLLIECELSDGKVYKLAGTANPITERANSFKYQSVPGYCVARLACHDHQAAKHLTEELWHKNELVERQDGNWFKLTNLYDALQLSPNALRWVIV